MSTLTRDVTRRVLKFTGTPALYDPRRAGWNSELNYPTTFEENIEQPFTAASLTAEMIDGAGGDPTARQQASEALNQARALHGLEPYLGQVATRSWHPTLLNTTITKANAQTGHFARDEINAVQVAYANWYSNNNVNEAGSGGPATFTASIQYPIGSPWQQFTWNGGAAVITPNGQSTPLSDTLTLVTPIPKGQRFLCRVHVDCAAGICLRNVNINRSPEMGDVMDVQATSQVDATMNGAAIPATTGSPGIAPIVIVGMTTRPSFYLLGDSRQQGTNEQADATGDVGEWARSIGPYFGYGNYGVSGEALGGTESWLSNHSRRLALATYFSHICGNYSINDIRNGRSAAQLVADVGAVAALFHDKIACWNTIMASSTSTDAWATIANQTPFTIGGGDTVRQTFNALLRAGNVSGVRVFDTAAVLESGAGGKLIAPGESVTPDGVHLNAFGSQLIKHSGVINPAAFGYPL